MAKNDTAASLPTAKPELDDAAKKLTPEETKPLKHPPSDLSGLHMGDMVEVQLGEGRKLHNPTGGFYNPLEVYTLPVTVTLLRRLRHGDWVLYTQPANG